MLSLLLGCPLKKEKRKESVCACLHRGRGGERPLCVTRLQRSAPIPITESWERPLQQDRGWERRDSFLQVLLKCREQQQLVMSW